VARTLCLLLTLFFYGLAWSALDTRKQELQDLRGRIEQLKKDIEHASQDRAGAADALKSSERSISDVNRNLRNLVIRRRQISRKIDKLRGSADQVSRDLADQEQRLRLLLKQRYIQGGDDALQLVLNGKDPSDIARNLEYLRYVGIARAGLINDYHATLTHLQDLQSQLLGQKASLKQVRDKQLSQKKQLVAEKSKRQAVLARLSSQIRAQRHQVSTMVRNERRLRLLIDRLAQLAEEARLKSERRSKGKVVDRVADASLAGYAFAKLKGRLALPVAGKIIDRYGQPRAGGGPAWKGLFIRAPEGGDVHAVASGRVAFADWLRGFGNLIIIDHGGGYLSLYSNNESLYKQAGDTVHAGDVIAAVGNTGGQEQPGLYFELRRQGRPFDPLTWVNRK
jgi:septal ring factor EnvC (AmiA/AmiB activator)